MSTIALFSDLNYYLYAGRADMRKSFDGFSGIIVNELGREVNVYTGAWYPPNPFYDTPSFRAW